MGQSHENPDGGRREPWECLERAVGGRKVLLRPGGHQSQGGVGRVGVGREGAATQATQAALGFMPEE